MSPPRLRLAHLPTPLTPAPRIGAELGIDLWVKRDDATGGPEAGNKIRKLEFLLAEAMDQGADTLITCGGLQSNHARATAVLAAQLGWACVLLLRDPELPPQDDGVMLTQARAPLCGNLLIDRMLGAEVRLITAESYRKRAELMASVAAELRSRGRHPYVIPEGGSSGLGSLGYVAAMAEVREQMREAFDVVVVACGSGGTAAGIALGAALHGVAKEVRAIAVCNDRAYFDALIPAIVEQARSLDGELVAPVPCVVDERFKGPSYGVSTESQRQSMLRLARGAGLLLDPVYSGKAFHALERLAQSGELAGKRVMFVHTGGLPGLLAQPDIFGPLA